MMLKVGKDLPLWTTYLSAFGVRLPGLREERAARPQMRLGSRQHVEALSRLRSETHRLRNGFLGGEVRQVPWQRRFVGSE